MRTFILVVLTICIAALLHRLLQVSIFSLFMAPLALSVVFSHNYILPKSLLAALVAVSELLTTLPPGIMTIVILTPYMLRFILHKIHVDLTLTYYAFVVGIVTLQLFFLIASQSLQSDISFAWNTIPYTPLLYSLITTSSVAFILAIVWHELTPQDIYEHRRLPNH